jgi:hypothetical protein
MKNKVISTIIVVVIFAISGINVTVNINSHRQISSLKLHNINALTQESGGIYYTNKMGRVDTCTLYVYYNSLDQSYQNSASQISNPHPSLIYMGTSSGYRDSCPYTGNGCNAYTCKTTS